MKRSMLDTLDVFQAQVYGSNHDLSLLNIQDTRSSLRAHLKSMVVKKLDGQDEIRSETSTHVAIPAPVRSVLCRLAQPVFAVPADCLKLGRFVSQLTEFHSE